MSKSNTNGLARLTIHIAYPHTIPKQRIDKQHLGEFSLSQVHFLHFPMKLKRHDLRAQVGARWRDNLGARRRDSHFLIDNGRAAARPLGARRRDSHTLDLRVMGAVKHS